MRWPFRITEPLLDVVQALNKTSEPDHGWHLAEVTGQSGPNVYRALRRLQVAAWVDCEWVDNVDPSLPRRRVYHLTAEGRRRAIELLAERRPPLSLPKPADGVAKSRGGR